MSGRLRRREIVAGLAIAATLRTLTAAAQAARVPTIGVLVAAAPGSDKFWRLFRESMAKLGYVDGKTVRYTLRSNEGHLDRLRGLAAELVRHKVDLIVTWFTPAAIAARNATHEIPIVMAIAGDPVATGLVKSLARPGGNITGEAGVTPELAAKTLEFLRDMLPSARRMAVLVNVPDPFSKPFLEQVRHAGAVTGIAIEPVMIYHPAELEAAFAGMAKHRPDAVIVQPSLPTERAAQLALEYRLPSACAVAAYGDVGGLMSYGFNEADTYRHAAEFVDKILKGAKPADLPVQRPSTFELVINIKTAKALGLTVPRSLLAEADKVIE
jgi:putative tryptophan/tyrosine transport system substrate-binding protein